MSFRDDIIGKVRGAGVIGAGGAGFPTYAKLQNSAEYYIANGAECEPLLQSDQKAMLKFPDEILAGLRIAMAVTEARFGIVAVKKKNAQSIAALDEALNHLGMERDITIHPLDDFYPVGDEQVLVYETTGRIVPESGLPLDVGCIVNNVITLRQVFHAMQGTPVTHRLVTVIGEVKRPGVLNLPIGTPIERVIDLCGGATVDDVVTIDGGPMMGTLRPATIRKTTSGIIVLPADHRLVKEMDVERSLQMLRTMSICDQCFACTEVCPRYQLGHRLEPHLVMRDIANGIGLDRENNFLQMAYLCCHCDLCRVWGCPVELAPGRVMQFLKEDLAKRGDIPNPYHEKPVAVRQARDGIRPPVAQLVKRLGIVKYDKPVEICPEDQGVHEVRLELNQHIGVPCRPVVKKGESVKVRQVIADVAPTELGCPIHSPIEGTVTDIDNERITIAAR